MICPSCGGEYKQNKKKRANSPHGGQREESGVRSVEDRGLQAPRYC